MTTKDRIHTFDYLIAGGGIAGLYTAYRLAKSFPTARICILEASSRLGGRLHSIPLKEGTVLEAGGARFNTNQHRILALIHELGLDSAKVPINNEFQYIPSLKQRDYDPQLETIFPTIDPIIQLLETHIRTHHISKEELINTNLITLITRIYKSQYPTIDKYIVSSYPYYSELHSLNALEALSLFTNEFAAISKYFILAGGLEQLITKIHEFLKSRHQHIEIHLNTPLQSLACKDSLYIVTSLTIEKPLAAKRVILALPRPALEKIRYLTRHPHIASVIKSVQPEPLYRIYACYPPGKNGKVWFDGMPKVVSNLPIKYIIPSDMKRGVIMISYTDSKYARYWFKKLESGNDMLEKELARQLEILFPDKNIPPPRWIKHYYWDMGAAYWKLGASRTEGQNVITQPLAGEPVYICNENYSSHQAWVEGSLEMADMVLDKILHGKGHDTPDTRTSKGTSKGTSNGNKQKKTKKHLASIHGGATKKNKKKTDKWPIYTLEEVAKHNKKTDAWIVINKVVANITKWIPQHPGGAVIMKGVGKDATSLFKAIGHDAYARKMLRKYQIGLLA